MSGGAFVYEPDGQTLTDFFWDRSPVSIIQGPIGSGTSTACIMKMWCIANEQEPGPDGVRRTRWLIVRNTYSDLLLSTMASWSMWMESNVSGAYGELKKTRPPHHHIKTDCVLDGGKTFVDAEFIFLALDQEEDIRKLMSTEPTGIFYNECQFLEKKIFDEGQSRVALGRYPPKMHGGPTWKGIIGDMNAPSEGHFIPYMRGDVPLPVDWEDDVRREYTKPDDWKFFVQPPGLIEEIKDKRVVGYKENPDAENKKWLSEGFLKVISGKPKEWIDARVMNRVGLYRAGRAVFESFRPEFHIATEKLNYIPDIPLIVGLDFARNPAAVFCQNVRGQFVVLSEFGAENVASDWFAPRVRQHIAEHYPDAKLEEIQFWGDPTGDSQTQSTDITPYQIFLKHGMMVRRAPGNNKISIRLEAMESLLNGVINGRPKLLICPTCRVFKTAMGGGYHYAKVKGQSRYAVVPSKDRFADYADAGQYGVLGAGFGAEVILGKPKEGRPPKPRKQFSIRRHGS